MPKVHVFGKRLSTFVATFAGMAICAAAIGAYGQEAQSGNREATQAHESTAPKPPAAANPGNGNGTLAASADSADQGAKAATAVVEEPPVYYVRDKDGHIVPLLGVSLEEFRELLRQKSATSADGNSPKVNLQQVALTGEVRNDHVEFTAEYKIQTVDAQWVNVPLVSAGAVLIEPAEYQGAGKQVVQFDSETGTYTLRLQGSAGSLHLLKLKFMVPMKTMGTQHRVEFTLPNAAASHLAIKLQQSTLELQEFSGCVMAEVRPAPDDSHGRAELQAWGLGGSLALVWKEGSNGKSQPILESAGQVLARIDSRSVQFDTLLSVRSFGLPFDRFRVKLPKGAQLIGGAPNGATYNLTPGAEGDAQFVDVQLPQKTTGPVDVRLQAESAYDLNAQNPSMELAGFDVREAAPHRQWGHIAVAVVGDWQPIWGPLNHVRQIADLPDSLRRADVVAGFEYLGQGASLRVRMTPRKTRIAVEGEYVYFVEPHQVRLDAHLKYTIHGAKTSSLEIAMPGWQIDEIGPENTIDGNAALENQGASLNVPLLHPTSGELEVTIQAHRDLAPMSSELEIKLPVPVADVPGPGLVALVAADNIRLAPSEGEQQGLTRPTVAPRMKLPAREQSPIFFRQEQPQAIFTGIIERLPQLVRMSIDSNLDLRHDGIQVEQTLNYRVEHEPITSLTLDVPKMVTTEGHLELLLDDHAVGQLPVSFVSDDDQRSRVEVPLASPRSGNFQLVARYVLPQSKAVIESGQPFTVPLIAPTGVEPEHDRLAVQSDTTLRILASEEAWEVADEPLTSVAEPARPAVHFKALRPTSEITLVARPEAPRNLANIVVSRAWIQTWISGTVRQDRAVYQFTTTKDQLQLQLPHEVPTANIEIRLDHQLLATPDSNDIRVSVPFAAGEQAHVLEVRYQLANATGQANTVEAELPRLGTGVWVQRLYWQLVLPSDQHLIGAPAELTPEFTWDWMGWGWARRNVLEQAAFEDWIGATRQDPLPAATNRYVFSMAGIPEMFVARTAARWQLVLSASAMVLVAGWLLLKVPTDRKPAVLFGCGVILLALSAWLTDVAMLFGQAGMLGLALLLLAGFLQRLVIRRHIRMVPIAAVHENSVLHRSNSPIRFRQMSLAASSTTTGPGEVDLPPAESQDE
jgi:hypothetical protein